MKDITSNGGKWVQLTICKMRTVSISLDFLDATSGFGLLPQGEKQIN